jgi:hypothetical protein
MKRYALVLVLIFGFTATASARTSYLQQMLSIYGISASSKLNSCATCHGATLQERNDYGRDLDAAGVKNNAPAAFAATDNLDSDSDGALNWAELAYGTWPGDAGDTTPAASSTWGRIKALFE